MRPSQPREIQMAFRSSLTTRHKVPSLQVTRIFFLSIPRQPFLSSVPLPSFNRIRYQLHNKATSQTMALPQMATYTYDASTPGPSIASAIFTQHRLGAAQNPFVGPRLHLETAANLQNAGWPQDTTKQVMAATHAHGGIFTTGQSHCMCIAVALYNHPADTDWTYAWLVHVSGVPHSGVQNIIDKLTVENHNQAYVVIGAKQASLNWMLQIRDRFLNHAHPPRQLWIYSANEPGNFGFGISRSGAFGQVL